MSAGTHHRARCNPRCQPRIVAVCHGYGGAHVVRRHPHDQYRGAIGYRHGSHCNVGVWNGYGRWSRWRWRQAYVREAHICSHHLAVCEHGDCGEGVNLSSTIATNGEADRAGSGSTRGCSVGAASSRYRPPRLRGTTVQRRGQTTRNRPSRFAASGDASPWIRAGSACASRTTLASPSIGNDCAVPHRKTPDPGAWHSCRQRS